MEQAGPVIPLERIEWMFPLKGRWLRYFLAAPACLFLAVTLLCGLYLAQVLPQLASARDLRVGQASNWALREQAGPWSRAGAAFHLQVGPMVLRYTYPPRDFRSAGEPLIRLALQACVLGLPLLVGRSMLRGSAFWRFAGAQGLLSAVLLFPLAIGCDSIGYRTMPLWHLVFGLLSGQF